MIFIYVQYELVTINYTVAQQKLDYIYTFLLYYCQVRSFRLKIFYSSIFGGNVFQCLNKIYNFIKLYLHLQY